MSSSLELSLNIQAEALSDGSIGLRCDGIPGRTYAVQFTEVLNSPNWQTLAVLVADQTGAFEHADHPPPDPPQRFYRSIYP